MSPIKIVRAAICFYLVLLFTEYGRVQAAEPVLYDAFVYQVTTVEQARDLQQALCRHFGYEPQIFDQVYVTECQGYHGPERIPPVIYPLNSITMDPFCESTPVIANPENCPDFANRSMLGWFDTIIEKEDTALWQSIQTYTETARAAAKTGRGTSRIKRNQ